LIEVHSAKSTNKIVPNVPLI